MTYDEAYIRAAEVCGSVSSPEFEAMYEHLCEIAEYEQWGDDPDWPGWWQMETVTWPKLDDAHVDAYWRSLGIPF